MPRNVRNFWLRAAVDGRKGSIQAGPQAADGGFAVEVLIRRDGSVEDAGMLIGDAEADGSLSLRWVPGDGSAVIHLATGRR